MTVDDIKGFLNDHPVCFNYFPDGKEIRKLPKQWIVNVASTVIGKPFIEWLDKQIGSRNEKVAKDKDIMINADPDIAKVFNASTSVARKYLPVCFAPNTNV